MPVTLPVPVGGALSFTATAGDLAGNVTGVTTVLDNDGIDAAIDTQPLANSNDFSDMPVGGTTSGTIAARGGWTVRVSDLGSGGVQAVVSGAGTLAKISTCAAGGAEQVELDGAGETASVACVTTTDVNTGSQVTAIAATSPTGSPKILVRNAAGKVQARLSTTQWMTIGSPVTAGSTNIGSVLVELLDDEGAMFASFLLDAAESVDATFTTEVNDVPVVELHVLVGPVVFTIGTRTVTLDTGEAGTFPTDVTPPTIGSATVTPTVLWPANHRMVDAAVSYQVTDNRDPAPTCNLSVASNEPLDGTGDGDAGPDWAVIDARRLQLRAERSATGTGRIYTLTITCGDRSGNLATRQLAVTVPRTRRETVSAHVPSPAPSAEGIFDGADREKHRRRWWLGVRSALDRVDWDEPVFRVEADGVRLGIDDDAHATVVVRHREGELEDEAQELKAESLSLRRLVDPESGEPQHGQRIPWQLFMRGSRQLVDLNVGGSDGGKTEDTLTIDGHVGDAQMVPKLVLSRELLKEAIEVGVTRLKRGALVSLAECPNLHYPSGRGAPQKACPSRSASGSRRPTSSSRRVSDE